MQLLEKSSNCFLSLEINIMNTKKISWLIFFTACLAIFSFDTDKKMSPIEKIEAKYITDYELFRSSTSAFLSLLKNETVSTSELQQQYFKMRKSFKSIEYLWSFLDREFVAKYINGAPLPKVEPNAPDLKIIEPSGLQCIDEALFAYELDRSELIRLCESMLARLTHFSSKIGIRDQQFFDASKLAVVRLAYISSAGFDVPGSLQPFGDMYASLMSLEIGFENYKLFFSNDNELLSRLEDITKQINLTKKYIDQQSNFEKLDRVNLLRNYLNPLFSSIVQFHNLSGFETYYEVTNQSLGINLLAENLINESLLDKKFFFEFPNDVDSSNLIALGKTLFYDPVLSSDLTLSCASCHNPKKAFSDGVVKSITHHGKDTVDRNAPGLLNAVYAEKYFYDLRTEHLMNQIEHVVFSKKEMSSSPMGIIEKLSKSEEYKKLFEAAFGKVDLKYQDVALALASYVSVLTDFDTEVDNYLTKKVEKLPKAVYDGMNIFYGKGQCASCHFGPTYAGLVPPFYLESESEVLGVPDNANKRIAKADQDIGRFINLKQRTAFYRGSQKTTSTRNVKYTAPYMHNGVFETLEELIDFYNDGGGNGWGFNLKHQTLASDKLNLSDKEKKNLIAFLNSLSSDVAKFEKPKSLPKFDGEYSKWNQRGLD